MRRGAAALPPRRQRVGRASLLLAAGLCAAAASFNLFPTFASPGLVQQEAAPGELAGAAAEETDIPPDAFAAALRDALDQVQPLRAEVDEGRVVNKFGEKAQAIVAAAAVAVGGPVPELDGALDGALHVLFLRQLALVRQQLEQRFKVDRRKGLTRADQQFVAQAEVLLRPGSDWSYEEDRTALRTALEDTFRQDAALARERSRVAQTQRATADVIGKLQKQMEQLGEKLRGMGAGSPWVLWTTYRLPGTPFQMSGRYQEGRANIELNLTPNKDPANAEAGFVEGLRPQNLGLSLNIGV